MVKTEASANSVIYIFVSFDCDMNRITIVHFVLTIISTTCVKKQVKGLESL